MTETVLAPQTKGKSPHLIALTVALVTVLLYLRSLSCGFINLDDPFYITNNPLIKDLSAATVARIFTEAHLGTWLPLTYVSFAFDYRLWGDNPTGYHLTNSLLHGANAYLMVLIIDRLLRRREPGSRITTWQYSLIVTLGALVWGVHPLRVESVAWVAERKDVLNGFFTLAAVVAYLTYARRKDCGDGSPLLPYLTALGFFVLSLLAKQVSVTLPAILLLLDWYPLRRHHQVRVLRLLLEKLPFMAIAAAVTAMAIYFAAAQKLFISLQDIPLTVRAVVSGHALYQYWRLSVFPTGISPYFVLPKPLPFDYLVKSTVVAVVSVVLIRYRARTPAITATWFAFVILVSPMLAFVQAGDDIALAARYTYLAAIPFSIGLTGVMLSVAEKGHTGGYRLWPALGFVAVVLFIIGNMAISWRLIGVWRDTGTFWSRVITIQPVGRAYGDRGVFYLISGKASEAVEDFTAAIAIAQARELKTIYNLYAFRGLALSDMGRYSEAIVDFDRAIAIFPHPTYFQLRGAAQQAMGRSVDAARDFRRAGPNPPAIDWF